MTASTIHQKDGVPLHGISLERQNIAHIGIRDLQPIDAPERQADRQQHCHNGNGNSLNNALVCQNLVIQTLLDEVQLVSGVNIWGAIVGDNTRFIEFRNFFTLKPV